MSKQEHPLKSYSNEEKMAYLSVLTSIALADMKLADSETETLLSICQKAGLNDEDGKKIIAADDIDTNVILKNIDTLVNSELKYTLLTDCFFIAYADKDHSIAEKELILKIALVLQINQDQVAAIENFVKTVYEASKGGLDAEFYKTAGATVTGALASVGVPLGAVAVSGTVFGLGATGITSGLAALGLGFGMATGVGVVAAAGVVSFLGVRWIVKKVLA